MAVGHPKVNLIFCNFMDFLEETGGFTKTLKQSHGTNKVLLLNSHAIYNQITKDLLADYHVGWHFRLETFDFTVRVPSIAKAPLPILKGTESSSEIAAKRRDIWAKYPKYGLTIWLSQNENQWANKGTIPIQNDSDENWIPILRPYLLTESDVLLMTKRSQLAVQMTPSRPGWLGALAADDEIVVSGIYFYKITLIPKTTTSISIRQNFAVNLPEGIPTIVRNFNNNRKYLYFTNDSSSTRIYFIFGSIQDLEANSVKDESSKIIQCNALSVLPGASFNYSREKYLEPEALVAVAIGGDGRLTGLEAS